MLPDRQEARSAATPSPGVEISRLGPAWRRHADLSRCRFMEVERNEVEALLDDADALVAERDRLLAFVDAVSPFVRDVLDEPFPWEGGGQVYCWMSREEYDEALAALGELRD